MFNLETAISEWRRQMLAAGIKSPVPLEELESHLREDIEQKTQSGLGTPEAWAAAIKQMGGAPVLKAEFKKIPATERINMKQTLIILASLLGTVFGGAMALPALGRWHHTGILIWWPLVVGPALVIVGGAIALYGLKHFPTTRAQNWIKAAIITAGCFYLVPLIQAPFVQSADLMGWTFCVFLAMASILFFGTCLRYSRNASGKLIP